MSILLTPRWFDYPQTVVDHAVQADLKTAIVERRIDNAIIAAGRRSYKTERFLKRFFVSESISRERETSYLGGPTRQQAKEIFWQDIKDLSPAHQVFRISETELKIWYRSRSTLHVVGLDAFKRIQGGMAHRVGLTEFQECDPGVYTQSFEPMLNDTGGLLVAEGRPLGKNHLYDFYLKGVNGSKGWGAFHWKSSEILKPEQIERAKENLSEADYAREYDASFETDAGNPYHSYSVENNKAFTILTGFPLIITCDFNATEKPMSWVVGQRVNESGRDVTYWTKVFANQFTYTKMMCDIVIEWLKTLDKRPNDLHFYGDYSGVRHESNSSFSDWEIIEQQFRNQGSVKKFLRPCRSIRNSIAATNGQLRNANGIRKQFVNPDECKPLIADWQRCIWKANSRELEDEDVLRGHACRAVDYYNDYEYPVKPKTEWSSL